MTAFSDSGFAGASTRSIAALAGIEQGHLAYYFPTKISLWEAVVETFAREGERYLATHLVGCPTMDPVRVAEQVLPEYLRSFARNPRLTRLMLQEFSVDSPRHNWVVQNLGKPVWDLLLPLFNALAAEGRLGGASPSAAYFNMLGAALITFGNPELVAKLTGTDVTDSVWVENAIQHIMRSVLAPADEEGPKG